MPQGYPRGPQFNPQMMASGVPMVQQTSQQGAYMNGPPPGAPSYSPMPPHATPHMQHMQPAYQGSPRPHMMQHSASHQGYQQQPPPNMHMPPQFAPNPGQPHPYAMQQRQYSHGGMPQMTPRQQQAMPHHASPGMSGQMPGQAQGDEGK